MLKRFPQEKYEEGKKQKKDPTGLAFKNYEAGAGDFFKEMLKRFFQESKKQKKLQDR